MYVYVCGMCVYMCVIWNLHITANRPCQILISKLIYNKICVNICMEAAQWKTQWHDINQLLCNGVSACLGVVMLMTRSSIVVVVL